MEMNEQNNMTFYNAFRAVPKEALKPIAAGRLKGMSDINPMWRIQRLTEIFGPCGVGWWYTIDRKEIITDETTKQKAAFVDITLFFVDPETGMPSHGIPGTGGSSFVAQEKNGAYLSDECFKMALTDAISIAAKALGVGADVWYSQGRSKYTAAKEAENSSRDEASFTCTDCGRSIPNYRMGERVYTPAEWAEGVTKEVGTVVCRECRKLRLASGKPQ